MEKEVSFLLTEKTKSLQFYQLKAFCKILSEFGLRDVAPYQISRFLDFITTFNPKNPLILRIQIQTKFSQLKKSFIFSKKFLSFLLGFGTKLGEIRIFSSISVSSLESVLGVQRLM
jgi:hypothetical protein